jgi:hypothetical protein
MPVPKYTNDGDFTSVKQNGPTKFRFPFYDKGDSTTFEAHCKMRVEGNAYQPLAVMATKVFYQSASQLSDSTFAGAAPVTCYLVEEGDTDDVGNGLLEWTRVYSPVPADRTEYASTSWAYQILRTIASSENPFSASVSDIQLNLTCRIIYHYQLTVPTTDLAPQVQVIASDGVNPCIITTFGSWGVITPGTWILSKGSESQIYKAGIYVKISTEIQFPTSALGSAPVISSAATASGTHSVAFSYSITASNTPTSYGATGLPAGLSVNTTTGVISGTPTTAAVTNVEISASNVFGTGFLQLVLTIA